MKLNVKYFQDGGQMGAPAPGAAAPAGPEAGGPPDQSGAPSGAGGGQDPLMQIAQILSQGLQAQDCQALAQGAQMFLELVSQAQGGGQGGQGGPPPEQPTVMKKGGKFVLKKKGENPFAKKDNAKEEKAEMAKKGSKMPMAKKC